MSVGIADSLGLAVRQALETGRPVRLSAIGRFQMEASLSRSVEPVRQKLKADQAAAASAPHVWVD